MDNYLIVIYHFSTKKSFGIFPKAKMNFKSKDLAIKVFNSLMFEKGYGAELIHQEEKQHTVIKSSQD